MSETGCIFCKIISGDVPSVKIWEDKNFLAILDVFPNTRGMTLVMPKRHLDSDIFSMEDDFYTLYMIAIKKVVKLLEKGLRVQRIAVVAEGMGVNHAHVKLYPLHGLGAEWKPHWAKEEIYFDQYEGYISTQLGPKTEIQDLQKVADEILGK